MRKGCADFVCGSSPTLGGTLSVSDGKSAAILMRMWVGGLAILVTVFAVLALFFPDLYSSEEPAAVATQSSTLSLLSNIFLLLYALALWAVTFDVRFKKSRGVVLSILLSGLVGWVGLILLVLVKGAPFEALFPLAMFLLIFGVPAILAVLLETKFKCLGESSA
jgi:hypothetical protein